MIQDFGGVGKNRILRKENGVEVGMVVESGQILPIAIYISCRFTQNQVPLNSVPFISDKDG